MRPVHFLAIILLASCLIPGVTGPPSSVRESQEAAQEQALVGPYDSAAKALATTDSATDSKQLLQAIEQAKQAASTATNALATADNRKRNGVWFADLHYKTGDGKVLTEAQVLTALAALRDRATAAQSALDAKLDAAYRSEYAVVSDAQMTELHHRGAPTKLETVPGSTSGGRHKHVKTPHTCWSWDTVEKVVTTCWNTDGTVASHEEHEHHYEAAATSEPASGDAVASTPAASDCEPNGADVAASSYCCSTKIHEIFEDQSNPYSGHKAWICCGSKDSATTNECH